ncbi:hypothetical protein [Nocardia flavorosea]|uniref:Uncharacterized protein n=1 Tax=Nocardia flavorosea TaxID=53429 RepID=A0A846YMR0_9NOCA|nr:hypothetical protein [Nocardia flavorosea]NKY60397.1 hypothetical protein [Nocardia flavorosea]
MTDRNNYDTTFGRSILGGLQGFRHIYAGTVPPAEVQKRRARNKAARKSRRANRG